MRNASIMLVWAAALVLPVAYAQDTNPLSVLNSDALHEEKAEACRILAVSGDRDAVPVLAALLTDEKLSHMARYALEAMPFPEAGAVLRDALGRTSGLLKVGIVNSLGIRKDKEAVPALIKLLSDSDPQVAQASALSLGMIATEDAAKALEDAVGRKGVPAADLRAFGDALCECAEKNADEGRCDRAIALYQCLLDVPNVPLQIQAAAFRGVVLAHGPKHGRPLLKEALLGENEVRFNAALVCSRELGGGERVTAALAKVLPSLTPERKIRLLEVLGERGGKAAGPAALAEAKAGPREVRTAALGALTRLGYKPALKLMKKLACAEDGDLTKIARDSLSYFPGSGREAAIKSLLNDKQAEIRGVAVGLINQGALEDPVKVLVKTAQSDADENVRVAALNALRDRAGIEEMPWLLDNLRTARSQVEAEATEGILRSLCERQKRAPGAVVIQEAWYGALPDGPSADVTEKVKSIVESGSLSVEASNANFGDPAPGKVKQLRVNYTENARPCSKIAGENETLKITIATSPPVIVDAFCNAAEKAEGEEKLALLRLLGSTGSPKAFDVVQVAASTGEGAIKDTALRLLCEWPTPDALPVVMELAKKSPDPNVKVLALRGAVQLLRQSGVSTDELLDRCAVLIGFAATADERKAVLGALAQVSHPRALELALRQCSDAPVRAEAIQAAITIAKGLGKSAYEDPNIFNGKDLTGWQGNLNYWRFEDGAIVGHSKKKIPRSEFLWSSVEAGDFYLVLDVQLEPNTANSGVQFRSKKIDEHGQALGYQADIGQDVWGRLYHEHGRGKLDWNDRAEKAVTPGQWNRYEILAIGPAIWTAINGTLGVAYLESNEEEERSGLISFQLHAGPPQTVRYRIEKLVHHPKVELAGLTAEQLISEISASGN